MHPYRPTVAPPTRRRGWGSFTLATLVVAAARIVAPADAHETDQFTLPPAAEPLADLGPDVTRWYYEVLRAGVDRANAKIAAAVAGRVDPGRVLELQEPESLANAVSEGCLPGNDIVDALEAELASPAMRWRHPGRAVCFREADRNIYRHAFSIFDTRILSRYWFGSTVDVFGHLVGTDKFGHFTSIGVGYYWRFVRAHDAGYTDADATAYAVRFGTVGRWSEDDLMGLTTTGDYANGDLSANFAGLLFFRNLARPMPVAGAIRPPLCVRDGPYWRLSPHVSPTSDFFRPFITDHWNEALNPGWFIESMRPALRRAVWDRRADVLRTYHPPHRLHSSLQDDFRARRVELSTYWGVDYGHRGDDADLVTIDNTCFGDQPAE